MSRIYVAGSWTARERLRPIIERLRALGNEVRATWTDHTEEGDPLEEARRDIAEVTWANVVVIDTIDRSSTGGSDFEFGLAYGLGYRQFFVVGPARSVFHRLARERWETWDAALSSGRFGGAGEGG